MTPLVKRLLVIVIAAAVVIPSAYLIIQQTRTIGKQSDPFSYIPAQPNAVLQANVNGTSLYVFSENGSFAIILPVDVSTFQAGIELTSGNSSSPTSVTQFGMFSNQQIYLVTNFSLSSISGFSSYIGGSLLTIVAGLPLNLSGNLYAADSGAAGMVIGNLSAVKSSISSFQTGNTFSDNARKFLDSASNFTFYASPLNLSGINYVTGNISDGHSSVYLSFSGNNSLGSFTYQGNLAYNFTVISRPHSLTVAIDGNYTVGQLMNTATSTLQRLGL